MKLRTLLAITIYFELVYASEKYVATWNSLENCEHPPLPYKKDNPLKVHVEIYNNSQGISYLQGSAELTENIKEDKNYAMMSVGFETQNGVKPMFELDKIKCESFVAKALFNALGIPFTKKCMLKKGIYDINKVDINKLDHVIHGNSARKYGVYVATLAFNTETYTMACWKARINVQPARKRI